MTFLDSSLTGSDGFKMHNLTPFDPTSIPA